MMMSSIEEMALLTGIPGPTLRSYMWHADAYYKTFQIPKRSRRGHRTINAPSPELKGLQWWVMTTVLRPVPLPEECMAFRRGRSIVSNASPHAGRQFVLNADIEDFFPSITAARVYGVFRHLGFSGELGAGLARLCTYRGALPQGAPSSPDIANIICRPLDARLRGLCARHDWVYTRYCDDLTISGSGAVGGVMKSIRAIVEDEGFCLNDRKTRVLRRGDRQEVTGLVVNEKPNVPRPLRRRIRAIFHQAKVDPDGSVAKLHQLYGYRGFLSMVSPESSSLAAYAEVIASVRAAIRKQDDDALRARALEGWTRAAGPAVP
jgi:hypothetical protein